MFIYFTEVHITNFLNTCIFTNNMEWGMRSKGSTVMRALVFHQCGLGSNPGIDDMCGLGLLLLISPLL